MAPAAEHDFDEPLPPAVVLDADFVANVLHEGEEFHNDCLRFALRMLSEDVRIIHTQLLRLEFLSAWQNAVRRRGVPTTLRQPQPRLLQDPEADRDLLFRSGDAFLSGFLSAFDRYEVRLGTRMVDHARTFMATHNLRPMDACLVAAAFRTDAPHIVSLDKDFLRVDGLHLWNDHIPERRERKRRARRR